MGYFNILFSLKIAQMSRDIPQLLKVSQMSFPLHLVAEIHQTSRNIIWIIYELFPL